MVKKELQNKLNWLIGITLNINLLFFSNQAKAFIPNIYIPNQKLLTETSLGIGFSAAKYIQFGQTKEAISLAKLAISLNPKLAENWIILSQAQASNNLLKEALKSINKAKGINPNIAEIWFSQASIEMQMGKTEAAIKSINKNIRINKKNANSYFLLGNARLMQKEHRLAIKAFKTSVIIDPNLWQSMNNEALIYFELGEKEKAIQKWRKVLKIKADPEPKLALAIALYSMEASNKESIQLAKEALQENPNYFFEEFQAEQLWGDKLRQSGKNLFKNPKLKDVITTASANSNFTNEKDE